MMLMVSEEQATELIAAALQQREIQSEEELASFTDQWHSQESNMLLQVSSNC